MLWVDWVAVVVVAVLAGSLIYLYVTWRQTLRTPEELREMEVGTAPGEGVERRARIDTENVKALLLINGGAAITLVTFLSAILVAPDDSSAASMNLVRPVAVGIVLCGVGLVLALVHNHLRRRCSMEWEKGKAMRGLVLGQYEPQICFWSWMAMFASVVFFVAAGYVVCRGLLLAP